MSAVILSVALASAGLLGVTTEAAGAAVVATGPPVAIESPAGVNGYTILDRNGHIYNFGTAYYGGAPQGATLPFVSLAYTPSGKGYAMLDSAGHVYNYGDSVYKGGAPVGATLPFRRIAYKPGTLGYTLMDKVGHIYNYGTTHLGGTPAGSTGNFLGFAYTPTGAGYTLMDTAGHIYNYGDSQYKGGAPVGATLPMRDLTYKPGTFNYTMVDNTGHVYNFGTVYLGGAPANAVDPMVGLTYSPTGNGYAISDAVGHIYNFGDSVYRGGIDSIMVTPPSGLYPVDPSYYRYVTSAEWTTNGTALARRCGSRALIQMAYDVAHRWYSAHPGNPLRFWDMNAPGHLSHRNGVDLDIDSSLGTVGHALPASQAQNIEWGKMWVDTGIVKEMYFDDAAVRAAVNVYAGRIVMTYEPGHDNHFHVRILDKYRIATTEACPAGVTNLLP